MLPGPSTASARPSPTARRPDVLAPDARTRCSSTERFAEAASATGWFAVSQVAVSPVDGPCVAKHWEPQRRITERCPVRPINRRIQRHGHGPELDPLTATTGSVIRSQRSSGTTMDSSACRKRWPSAAESAASPAPDPASPGSLPISPQPSSACAKQPGRERGPWKPFPGELSGCQPPGRSCSRPNRPAGLRRPAVR